MTVDRQTYTADLPDGTTITPIGGTITLDNNWAPYAQASLIIATPASLVPFDPRASGDQPPKVVIHAFQEFNYSEPLSTFTTDFAHCSDITTALAHCSDITTAMIHDLWDNATIPPAVYRSFTLVIVEYLPQDDGTTTLTLESIETLLMDRKGALQVAGDIAAVSEPYASATALRYYAWNKIYDALYEGGFFTSGNGYDPGSSLFDYDLASLEGGTPVANPPYSVYWDFLQTYVQLAGGRLWCDELEHWHLEQSPTSSPGTVVFDASASAIKWSSAVSRKSTPLTHPNRFRHCDHCRQQRHAHLGGAKQRPVSRCRCRGRDARPREHIRHRSRHPSCQRFLHYPRPARDHNAADQSNPIHGRHRCRLLEYRQRRTIHHPPTAHLRRQHARRTRHH
jgi:hypothetical protein